MAGSAAAASHASRSCAASGSTAASLRHFVSSDVDHIAQHADLLDRVRAALVHAGAGALGAFPGVAAAEVALPEGPGAALRGAVFVDAAHGLAWSLLAVQKDTVVAGVGQLLIERGALERHARVLREELGHGHIK